MEKLSLERYQRHESPKTREPEIPNMSRQPNPKGRGRGFKSHTSRRLNPKYLDTYLSGSGYLGMLRASCIALRTQHTASSFSQI
jgi:hypothetical protein